MTERKATAKEERQRQEKKGNSKRRKARTREERQGQKQRRKDEWVRTSIPSSSKFPFHGELHAARGVGLDGVVEEGGADYADVGGVVGVVEDVECIEGDRERAAFLFIFVEGKFAGEVEVNL